MGLPRAARPHLSCARLHVTGPGRGQEGGAGAAAGAELGGAAAGASAAGSPADVVRRSAAVAREVLPSLSLPVPRALFIHTSKQASSNQLGCSAVHPLLDGLAQAREEQLLPRRQRCVPSADCVALTGSYPEAEVLQSTKEAPLRAASAAYCWLVAVTLRDCGVEGEGRCRLIRQDDSAPAALTAP